jgi:hypothetical protein
MRRQSFGGGDQDQTSEWSAEAVDLVLLDEADVLSQVPLAPWAVGTGEAGSLDIQRKQVVPILQVGQFDAKVAFSCRSWGAREMGSGSRELVLTEGGLCRGFFDLPGI